MQGGPENQKFYIRHSSLFFVFFVPRGTTGTFLTMNTTVSAWMTRTIKLITIVTSSSNLQNVSQILLWLTIFIAFFGMAVNAIVVWLLGFHIHRTPFSVYILNLAIADFLFLCCYVIVTVHPLINIFHFMLTQMLKCFIIMGIFAYIASLSMLSAISTEPCLSVLFPIWHHCRHPRHTSTIMCALLWALSLLLSFLEGSLCGFLLMGMNVALCQTTEFILSIWMIVLFVVLFGSSLALLVWVLCGSRRKFVTRLYMTIGLTVLAFLLGDLPFGLQNLLMSLFNIDLDISSGYAFVVSYTLFSINRCTNPIIYFFQNLKLILQRALQDTPEDQCVDPPSQQALQMFVVYE
uniref:G-protein coupled receptors family 1 profile domain-containing protein n=1 Tax=Marmota marmota marmota TaxID=9994 RepID=A0A8C5Z0G7_MARMA